MDVVRDVEKPRCEGFMGMGSREGEVVPWRGGLWAEAREVVGHGGGGERGVWMGRDLMMTLESREIWRVARDEVPERCRR